MRVIDTDDIQFAIRVDDFDETVARLVAAGFHETEDRDDPDRMIVSRTGLAGFPQVYIMDPDGNLIEINAEGRD